MNQPSSSGPVSSRGGASLRSAVVVSAASVLFAIATSVACASAPDVNRTTVLIQPDYDTYITQVDEYLTRRCGSLDCHGQPGRAYRIYSREGLRNPLVVDDAGRPILVTGQQATVAEEQRANFQALVALEPEETTRVMARQGENPNTLLFLRKPLKLERHKGGPAMAEEDPGYVCVVAWLQIPVVDGTGLPIPPAERQKLSSNALRACADARSFP